MPQRERRYGGRFGGDSFQFQDAPEHTSTFFDERPTGAGTNIECGTALGGRSQVSRAGLGWALLGSFHPRSKNQIVCEHGKRCREPRDLVVGSLP